MAQDDWEPGANWLVFLGIEISSQHGSNAQQGKRIRRNDGAGHMEGFGSPGKGEIVHTKYRETFENVVLLSPVQKRRIGHIRVVRPPWLGGIHRH